MQESSSQLDRGRAHSRSRSSSRSRIHESPIEQYLREVAPEELEEQRGETRAGDDDTDDDHKEQVTQSDVSVDVDVNVDTRAGAASAVPEPERVDQTHDMSHSNSVPANTPGAASLLVLQEQLNHLLVSYLSSPAHIHALQLDDEDEATPLSDSRLSSSNTSSTTDRPPGVAGDQPVVLTRRGQFILLSLFGLLVAYPHLPVPWGIDVLYSVAGSSGSSGSGNGSGASLAYSLWKATPPVLVATGLATIWAGQQASTPSIPPSVAPLDPTSTIQDQLRALQGAVKRYLLSLNSYDSAVDRCIRSLELLESTAASQGHIAAHSSQQLSPINDSLQSLLAGDTENTTFLPAQKVRQALLTTLVSVEIAVKVALDRITKEIREERSTGNERHAVVDREELERLVGMYASKATAAATPGVNAPRPFQHFGEARTEQSQLSPGSSPHHHQFDNGATHLPQARTRRSPQLAHLYDTDDEPQASPSLSASHPASRPPHPPRNTSDSNNRRASWAAFSPSTRQQHSSFSPTVGANAASLQTVQFGSPLSNFARSPSTSALHRKTEKARRRRSEQLPLRSWHQSAVNSIDGLPLPSSPTAALRSPPIGGRMSIQELRPTPTSAGMRLSRSSESPVLPRTIEAESERARTLRRLHTLHSPVQTSSLASSRRTRPLSMFELDFNKLREVENRERQSQEERRWSSHSQHNLVHVQAQSVSGSSGNRRQRPMSLYLQRSPMSGLSSPPNFSSETRGTWDGRMGNGDKLGLESLAQQGEEEKRMRREMICILLAVRYDAYPKRAPSASSSSSHTPGTRTLQGDCLAEQKILIRFLGLFAEVVKGLSGTLKAETLTLGKALEAEFGTSSALLTPLSPSPRVEKENNSSWSASTVKDQRTPRQAGRHHPQKDIQGLQIRFPGQYPQSPMIEVDPATPPSTAIHIEGTEYPFKSPTERATGLVQTGIDTSDQEQEQASFAPREPLSSEERQAKEALVTVHSTNQEVMKTLAAKMYLEKTDLERYFASLEQHKGRGGESVAGSEALRGIVERHNEARRDLEKLLAQHNEGRLALRQLELKRAADIQGSKLREQREEEERQDTSSTSAQVPDLGDDSMISSSALGKRDSTSSTLSTTTSDTEFLSTPATSPLARPSNGNRKKVMNEEFDVSQLLLDQTNPRHLPPAGLEEQLFEAFVGREVLSSSNNGRRLTREERIALAKQKREEAREAGLEREPQPLAQMELVNELKDVVALLRSRREVVPSEDVEQ